MANKHRKNPTKGLDVLTATVLLMNMPEDRNLLLLIRGTVRSHTLPHCLRHAAALSFGYIHPGYSREEMKKHVAVALATRGNPIYGTMVGTVVQDCQQCRQAPLP